MKPSVLVTLATAFTAAVIATYGADPVLITVDVSNPAAVTFTATGLDRPRCARSG